MPDAPRLPTTLDGAVTAFASTAMLREAMGDLLFDAVVAVRRAEHARFLDVGPDEIAAATRWIY